MHDIDPTQMEYGSETAGFEAERFDYEGEWGTDAGAVLSDAEEYELARTARRIQRGRARSVPRGLISKVARGAGKLFRGPIGQAVGGVLKGVAKKALPLAGALDSLGPLGAKIASGVASASGDTPGVEGEALGQEDEQFEGAKQFVFLAADGLSAPRSHRRRRPVSSRRSPESTVAKGRGVYCADAGTPASTDRKKNGSKKSHCASRRRTPSPIVESKMRYLSVPRPAPAGRVNGGQENSPSAPRLGLPVAAKRVQYPAIVECSALSATVRTWFGSTGGT
jgi:hypothetical protein